MAPCGEGVLDIDCRYCGRSGSVAIAAEDLNW